MVFWRLFSFIRYSAFCCYCQVPGAEEFRGQAVLRKNSRAGGEEGKICSALVHEVDFVYILNCSCLQHNKNNSGLCGQVRGGQEEI